MDDQTNKGGERDKKRSLRRYRRNIECISRLEEKLEILDQRITTIRGSNLSGMPRGGVPVTLDDLLSDKEDLERRINRLKVKGRELKRSTIEEIDSLEDPRYCEVLEAYFIDCLSIAEIADQSGYTERHVYNLYKEAIRLLTVLEQ